MFSNFKKKTPQDFYLEKTGRQKTSSSLTDVTDHRAVFCRYQRLNVVLYRNNQVARRENHRILQEIVVEVKAEIIPFLSLKNDSQDGVTVKTPGWKGEWEL